MHALLAAAVVIMVGLIAVPVPSSACDFCLLSQGISPLDTMKGSGIRVSERYTLLDRVYTGTSEQANPGAREEHWTTELTGFYGLTPELTILAVVPYKKGTTKGELDLAAAPVGLDPAGAGSASGIGDIAVLGRYAFLKQEGPESTHVLAGLAGIKFATGSTNKRTADGAEYLDSHLQPGTGSTDYLFGLSYSVSRDRLSLAANLLGTIATTGTFGDTTHRFGNAINYDLTGKYRISPEAFSPQKPQVFLALGLNGEAREREVTAGAKDPNSGGNTVYLSPGAQLVLAPHWVVELSYQHAVYHRLNGTQLGETSKSVGSATYLF